MLEQDYVYNARIVNVVDGDTVDMLVDLGFHTYIKDRFRLSGIDTAEVNSTDAAERKLAQDAKAWMANYLNKDVVIKSTKKDKYGRYLAYIYKDSEVSLNDQMLSLGLAKVYS